MPLRCANGDLRERYDFRRDLALAEDELKRVDLECQQAEQAAVTPETVKVENYPTPISKTVDGKEVHFQLLGGRLTFVPFDAPINQLREVLHDRGWKTQDQDSLTDTVGPVGGFRMRYYMDRVETPRGMALQLLKVEMIPLTSHLGEPLDVVLCAEIEIPLRLDDLAPSIRDYRLDVSDSFAEFRRLKKELYLMGYAVAVAAPCWTECRSAPRRTAAARRHNRRGTAAAARLRLRRGHDSRFDRRRNTIQLVERDRQRRHDHHHVAQRPHEHALPTGPVANAHAAFFLPRIGLLARAIAHQFDCRRSGRIARTLPTCGIGRSAGQVFSPAGRSSAADPRAFAPPRTLRAWPAPRPRRADCRRRYGRDKRSSPLA